VIHTTAQRSGLNSLVTQKTVGKVRGGFFGRASFLGQDKLQHRSPLFSMTKDGATTLVILSTLAFQTVSKSPRPQEQAPQFPGDE